MKKHGWALIRARALNRDNTVYVNWSGSRVWQLVGYGVECGVAACVGCGLRLWQCIGWVLGVYPDGTLRGGGVSGLALLRVDSGLVGIVCMTL